MSKKLRLITPGLEVRQRTFAVIPKEKYDQLWNAPYLVEKFDDGSRGDVYPLFATPFTLPAYILTAIEHAAQGNNYTISDIEKIWLTISWVVDGEIRGIYGYAFCYSETEDKYALLYFIYEV